VGVVRTVDERLPHSCLGPNTIIATHHAHPRPMSGACQGSRPKRRRAPGGCARLNNSFASAKRLHHLIVAGPKKARTRPQNVILRSQVSRSIHRDLQGLFRSSVFLALPGFLAGAPATFTLITYRWRRETFGDVTL